MTSKSHRKAALKKPSKPEDLELAPDAWPKFEQLIRNAAKGRPKPHSEGATPKKRKQESS